MKLLSAEQIRKWDEYTITNEPITSIDLMERASMAFVDTLIRLYPQQKAYTVICGPGNNGGDGLAIARLLIDRAYEVQIFLLPSQKYSQDNQINQERLSEKGMHINEINTPSDIAISAGVLVLDALFGTGLARPMEGLALAIIEYLNKTDVKIISVDIPSGMPADLTFETVNILKVAHCITFQIPKKAFLYPDSGKYIGDLHIANIGLQPDYLDKVTSNESWLDHSNVPSFKERNLHQHKGDFGHALIVAGSYGSMGACILAGKAALRSGTGLLTLHVPKCGYEIAQNSIPEAMVSVDKDKNYITEIGDVSKYSAIGIGPGIGLEKNTESLVEKLITSTSAPLVIDADAINIIAKNNWISLLPQRSILTPHPKEFERLSGVEASNRPRQIKQAQVLAQKCQLYIILKGGFTTIFMPDGRVYHNSTGNPGMATAGMGDTLTGLITGLRAQKYTAEEACLQGVYWHGKWGDMALKEKGYSLTASDLIKKIAVR